MEGYLAYVLETYSEQRYVAWTLEPFIGEMVDGPENGTAPQPWAVDVPIRRPFQKENIHVQIPHTAVIRPCYHCNRFGQIRCYRCSGRGKLRCGECRGTTYIRSKDKHGKDQRQTCGRCFGSGRVRCAICIGHGQTACPVCRGSGQLKLYIQLTVIRYTRHILGDTKETAVACKEWNTPTSYLVINSHKTHINFIHLGQLQEVSIFPTKRFLDTQLRPPKVSLSLTNVPNRFKQFLHFLMRRSITRLDGLLACILLLPQPIWREYFINDIVSRPSQCMKFIIFTRARSAASGYLDMTIEYTLQTTPPAYVLAFVHFFDETPCSLTRGHFRLLISSCVFSKKLYIFGFPFVCLSIFIF
eukprot:m.165920 g.165920  ORF g.165920 m.165920 type:complete len:357 (-) comp16434_c1_seq3:335-1405(-)